MWKKIVPAALVLMLMAAPAVFAAHLERPLVTQDELFAHAGEEIPGFGGLYYDEQGRANVFVTNEMAAQRFLDMGEDVVIHKADFEFRQLQDWRLRLRSAFELAGVTSLDVDETQNRIQIGLDPSLSATARQQVRQRMARLFVPEAAVTFVERQAFLPMATLGDAVRPIPGGVQINYGFFLCTHSYNATRGGVSGFVTNSHCTDKQGGVESTEYFQSSSSNSGIVAIEIADPDYVRRANGCPNGKKCRFSDSSFAAYTDASLSGGNLIARTESNGQFFGSLTIDANAPTFAVGGFADGAAAGQTVHKVGRTTGWTTGPVSQTCVDVGVQGSNVLLFCQTLVDSGVGGGDSGSPVFTLSGGTATVVGTLWGGNGAGTLFVFSPYSAIKAELGLD